MLGRLEALRNELPHKQSQFFLVAAWREICLKTSCVSEDRIVETGIRFTIGPRFGRRLYFFPKLSSREGHYQGKIDCFCHWLVVTFKWIAAKKFATILRDSTVTYKANLIKILAPLSVIAMKSVVSETERGKKVQQKRKEWNMLSDERTRLDDKGEKNLGRIWRMTLLWEENFSQTKKNKSIYFHEESLEWWSSSFPGKEGGGKKSENAIAISNI